jgi:thiamine biosynthesis lipoprotein
MKNQMKNILLGIFMVCLAATWVGCSRQTGQEENVSTVGSTEDAAASDGTSATREIFAMDTYMTLQAYGERAEEALDAAVEEINRLDDMFSTGNKDSEVSVANTSGSIYLSEETAGLIGRALDLYEDTDGAFDITIYPLMAEWGFTDQNFHVPTKERIEELLTYVDASKITYEEETGFLSLPDGVEIDLGGIAKGYTSGRVMEIFEEYGLTSGLVSLGGNVQAYRTKTDGSLWRVAVENPEDGEDYIGVLEIADQAVITSGGYERYFEEDGVTYHHILDPGTGYPAQSGLTSVTIVSDDGTLADGLSTSLFVMGKEKALSYWREHGDEFDAILVEEDGTITITEGIEDTFSSELAFTVAKRKMETGGEEDE